MGKLEALRVYVDIFLHNHPDGASREAREWMEQTDIGPADAAALARKGYTPATALARIEAAPVRWEDERDAEAAIDAMLYGPDVT